MINLLVASALARVFTCRGYINLDMVRKTWGGLKAGGWTFGGADGRPNQNIFQCCEFLLDHSGPLLVEDLPCVKQMRAVPQVIAVGGGRRGLGMRVYQNN